MRRRTLAFVVAICAMAALAGCGGGSGGSTDSLVVTPDPHVTPAPASDPQFSCTPRLAAVGTVSDLVLAGPCSFDYLGSATCRSGGTAGFVASLHLDLDGGGTLDVDVEPSGTAPGSLAIDLRRGTVDDVWSSSNAPVTLSADRRALTVRPVALAPVGAPGAGVETVRGVLTCG